MKNKKRYVTAGLVKEVRYQDAQTGGIRHRLAVTFYPPKPLFQRGEMLHIVAESIEESTKEAKKRLGRKRPPESPDYDELGLRSARWRLRT